MFMSLSLICFLSFFADFVFFGLLRDILVIEYSLDHGMSFWFAFCSFCLFHVLWFALRLLGWFASYLLLVPWIDS